MPFLDSEQEQESIGAALSQVLCDLVPDAIVLLDAELRIVYANRTMAGWLAASADSLRGQYYPTLVRGCDGFPHNCAALRAVACGTRESGEHEITSLCGTYECSVHPLKGADGMPRYLICSLRDVSEQKRYEAEQQRQAEYLAALHEIEQALIARRPLDSILHLVVKSACALVEAAGALIALANADDTEMRIRAAAGADAPRVGTRVERGSDVAGRVWETGQILVESLVLDPSWATPPDFTAFVDPPGPPMCAAGIPLLVESRVVGVLVLVVPRQPRHLQAKELALLQQLAERAAIAVHNTHLYAVVQHEAAERQRAERSLRESEAALRSIFRAAPIGIGMVSERVIEWANTALQQMVGRTADELVGRSSRLLYEDDAEFERVGREKYAQIETNGVGSVESRLVHSDGHLVHVLLSSAPLDPESYAVSRTGSVLFTALDITRSKQVEAELAAAQALLSAAIEQTPAGILVADAPDARIRIENLASINIRGGDPQELGQPSSGLLLADWQIFWPDGSPADIQDLPLSRAITHGETARDVELVIRRPTGEDRWVLASAAPVHDSAKIVAGVVVFPDITERKHAEEALRQSEARYRRFVEQSPVGVWEIDREGMTVFCNERLAEILGAAQASDLVGRRVYDFFSRTASLAAPLLPDRAEVSGWHGQGLDIVLKHADGSDVYGILSALPDYGPDGQFAGATLFVTDISTRRRMEEALRQSEARYRTLFESAGDAILIYDLEAPDQANVGRFLAANRVACQRLGYSRDELLSMRISDIELPEHTARLPVRLDELQRYGHHFYETVHVRADGGTIPTELSSRLILYEDRPAVLSVARDISERKQVEQVLLRTERLAAMGHLAAALAHEINNPLQSVGSSLELALDFPLDEAERLEYLEAVRQEISRLMTITGRVLDFARPTRTERLPVSLGDVAQYAFTLAEKQLQHRRIVFQTDLPADLPPVRASRDQLVQVFLNLLLNSMEAMPDGGGRVWLAARSVEGKVVVEFADNGPGIPAVMLGRMFEPFQTTKDQGTGLGLAISYSIIQQHGGTITAANGAEGGATFTITLPAWDDRDEGL